MRRRGQAAVMPADLESWQLFATLRGYLDGKAHRYDESKLSKWIEARQDWAERYGTTANQESMVAKKSPSHELLDLEVWCAIRGVESRLIGGINTHFDFAERQEAFRQWCSARAEFAGRYGWDGGREARRRAETAVEPFDVSAL